MTDDGIVFARKCLKEIHAILTAISLHPRPFSLEVTFSLHRRQCEYFILLARHNNLALRAFNNIDYSISSYVMGKIPVDLCSTVWILESSAFFSTFSMLHYVGLGIICFGGCGI